jgi:hypothetical protein
MALDEGLLTEAEMEDVGATAGVEAAANNTVLTTERLCARDDDRGAPSHDALH